MAMAKMSSAKAEIMKSMAAWRRNQKRRQRRESGNKEK